MNRRLVAAALGTALALVVMHGMVAATPAPAHGSHDHAVTISLCLFVLGMVAVLTAPPQVWRRLPRFQPVRRIAAVAPLLPRDPLTPLRA